MIVEVVPRAGEGAPRVKKLAASRHVAEDPLGEARINERGGPGPAAACWW